MSGIVFRKAGDCLRMLRKACRGGVPPPDNRALKQSVFIETSKQYRIFFDTLPFGAAVYKVVNNKDTNVNDLVFVSVNRCFENVVGLKADDIIGQTYTSIMSKGRYECRSDDKLLRTECITSPTGQTCSEMYLNRIDRYFRVFRTTLGEGTIAMVFVDCTEQKKLAHQLSVIKSDQRMFAGSISHDIYAPISAIKSLVSVTLNCSSGKSDSPTGEYVTRIMSSLEKASSNVEKLLELIKLPLQEVKWQPINLSAMAGEIMDRLRMANPDNSIETVVAEGVEIYGDLDLVGTALSNLIENAWKFSANVSEAKIEFGVTDNEKCICYVRDNGVGFDMQHADAVFFPFKRMHCERDFPGTGIGLTIVKKIVEMHNGKIWVESTPWKGSTFCFCINKP